MTAAKRHIESNRAASDRRTRHSQDVWINFREVLERGPKNRRRRLAAEKSFRKFCESYAKAAFSKSWSKIHLAAIDKIEDAVLRGKTFAFAMPRGEGKTTLCHWAMIWSVLCGHSPYSLFIGATAYASKRRLSNLKKTLRFNDALFEDFPEIIAPIRAIGNESGKARGQKFNGISTDIEWKQEQIVFATFDFDKLAEGDADLSKAEIKTIKKKYYGLGRGFGAIIDVASIEGEIRGRNFERQDGAVVRPRFAVVDDPQTRDSAKSLTQVEDREQKLKGDVGYLGGEDRVGVVVPCTVIFEGDLADRILNRELHPEYRGERSKMVEKFPGGKTKPDLDSESMRLWTEYRKIQVADLQAGGDGEKATTFYKKNRAAMEEGFVVSWPERFDKNSISKIQHAMNLYFDDEASFYAEAQNDPGAVASQTVRRLTAKDIFDKRSGVDRGIVPEEADLLILTVDISEAVLWWQLTAWRRSDFSGWIIDRGTTPEQGVNYYTLQTIRKTLAKVYPGEVFEHVLPKALGELVDTFAAKEYRTEDGRKITLDAIGIDAGWGEYANTVYRFCRRSKFKNILHAMKGVGITAKTKDLVDAEAARKKQTRESTLGQWKITRTKLGTPLLQWSTNFWKTRVASFFRTKEGNAGCLSVFQAGKETLQILADMLTSETADRVKSERTGRELDEWQLIPGRDNHDLDNLCMAGVLAHKLGARLPVEAKVKRTEQSRGNRERKEQGTERKVRSKRRRSSATF